MCDQFSLQWKSFVLNYGTPPVLMHPYDPCGDIVLDSQSMCRLDVQRLRGFRDNEWAQMLSDARYTWDDGSLESDGTSNQNETARTDYKSILFSFCLYHCF